MFQSPDEIPPIADEPLVADVAARYRRVPFAAVVLVSAAFVLLTLLALGRLDVCAWPDLCGPLLTEDINQGRLDTALPPPRPDLRLEQTFVPRRDGLAEIELLLVRYGETSEDENGRFTLELWDERGERVVQQILPTHDLAHNQVYTLRFAPQPQSAGRRYFLRLLGNETSPISTWGYSADVYGAGVLEMIAGPLNVDAPGTAARDLRFVTRYALTFDDSATAAAAPLREWRLTLAALFFLPLPGVLLLLLIRPRGWDPAAWLGAALALGVAVWPIIWYWTSLARGRWTGTVLWIVVAVGWGVAIAIAWRRTANYRRSVADHPASVDIRRRSAVIYILLAALIAATVASRFVAARDLAFPPWVDSGRHALITAVMAESGRTPVDYAPFLPVDHFPYHFGFHTLSTSLYLMTGRPLPGLLLFLMQFLGGLLPLTVYAAGWMVTRRRAVGLLAAFLVALPFFFPGYYATWGRMTQLAAMMVMPVLLALTWRLGRGWSRVWPLVGVLAAGLFLIHFRVFLFYVPFAALVAVVQLIERERVWALLKAATLAIILVLPRLTELLRVTDPLQTVGQSLPGYNDFPMGYITTGWERVYLVLAAVAAGIVLIGVVLRRRWATFPLLLLLWVGGLFVLLAGERLGLPETLVVNLNSMYITLFLPLALLLAIAAGQAWSWVGRWGRAVSPRRTTALTLVAGIAGGVTFALLALFGWRQQVNILNRQTILALPEDVAALAWADHNLPAGSRVAVNAWQWLGATWAGSDGGAWLVPMTGRESTTPPIDHIYNRELFAEARAFNEAASAVEDWGDPASAEWLAEQSVTHVFVGQLGGYFDPAELSRNPGLSLLYHDEGVFIFGVE